MLATAHTCSLFGVNAEEVVAEVDVNRGLPAFSVVGLPDAAVRESRERVRAAIVNSGFDFPLMRITANLAPADIRKAGPGFDLAIAAGVLGASGQLPALLLESYWLAGELALDGAIRPIPGVLAMAEQARRSGVGSIIVPVDNAREASLVEGVQIVALRNLAELRQVAIGEIPDPPVPLPEDRDCERSGGPDLAVLRGQPWIRRGLEIAACGGHSLMIVGPPGAGKSLAARCLPSIMPPLRPSEAIEVARIASATGRTVKAGGPCVRPYRAPHHTISAAGLVGGGNPFRPGEITLAHRGVLFLDELPEFSRPSLEALRGPMEDGRVVVTRTRYSVELPCRFMLAAAANPCPCGRGEDSGRCTCSPEACARYAAKLSAALSDRIDLFMSVAQPSADSLADGEGEASEPVRARVIEARERQAERLAGRCNADMGASETRHHARLEPAAAGALAGGHARLGLSARGWERVLRVARTVADMQGAPKVGADAINEALSFRRSVGDGGG